jgi:NADH-quinone oxidoreductase subunit A
MNPSVVFLLYMAAILGVVAVMLLLNRILGPKTIDSETKLEPFECGATPVDTHNVKAVPIKYYAVAIIFILFDLERCSPLPWARNRRHRVHALRWGLRAHSCCDPPRLQGAAAQACGMTADADHSHRSRPLGKSPPSVLSTRRTTRGWARFSSYRSYACCAMEFMAVARPLRHRPLRRRAAAFSRASPVSSWWWARSPTSRRPSSRGVRADVQAEVGDGLRVCATSGGFYRTTPLPIDKIIPVDIYIPGCPPRPRR